MRHFMIHLPVWVYAVDEYAPTKREALAQFRKRWHLNRMPKGYSIWEV